MPLIIFAITCSNFLRQGILTFRIIVCIKIYFRNYEDYPKNVVELLATFLFQLKKFQQKKFCEY